jgi:hypothetical protein
MDFLPSLAQISAAFQSNAWPGFQEEFNYLSTRLSNQQPKVLSGVLQATHPSFVMKKAMYRLARGGAGAPSHIFGMGSVLS